MRNLVIAYNDHLRYSILQLGAAIPVSGRGKNESCAVENFKRRNFPMKKRVLSLALAATMLFGTINFAVAEETPVQDTEEVTVSDTVESGSAASAEQSDEEDGTATLAADSGLTSYPKSTAGGWLASISGDVGGQEKLMACKVRSGFVVNDNAFDVIDATGDPYWEIEATGEDSVHLRAGLTDPASNTVLEASSVGKIASTSEGMAYYYKKVSKDNDFEMKATAKIKSINNSSDSSGNQVGFGAVVVDKLYEDTHYPVATNIIEPADKKLSSTPAYANTIVAGRLRMPNAGKGPSNGGMMNGWYRINGELYGTDTARSSYLDTSLGVDAAEEAPKAGSEYEITLRKSGSIYTLVVNDETTVIDAAAGHGTDELPITFDGDEDGNVCVGVALTRAADIEFTNLSLVETTPVESFTIESLPDKTDYYITEAFDPTGLALNVTYIDGTTAIVTDQSAYSLLGFDNTTNNSFTDVGERTVQVSCGSAERQSFTVNVRAIKVTSAVIKASPAQTNFFAGSKFNPKGITVRYTYEDGTYVDYAASNNKFTIDGTVFVDGDIIPAEYIGTKTVSVEYPDNINYDKSECAPATYDIDVLEGTITGIQVSLQPAKTIYYLGEEADYAGIGVQAIYTTADGLNDFRFISEDEYTITGLDTSTVKDSLMLTVTYNKNPALTTQFEVKVAQSNPVRVDLVTHPRYTYSVGEKFDPSGLEAEVLYSSGTSVELNKDGVYYIYDGTSYYNYATGETVDEAVAKAADYYIDASSFDTSKVTETGATTDAFIVFNRAVANFDNTTLACTVNESTAYVWKAALLGASAMGVKNVGTSEIYATINGTEYLSDKNQHNIEPQVMTNGTLPQVENVRLNSWDGNGKISGDQNGIAYYYTRVRDDMNFKISADVEVNRYVNDVNNLDAERQAIYDKAYAEYKAEYDEATARRMALDRLRSGQEAFGIMASDVVQLAGGLDETKNYTGGLNNHMTTDPNVALHKDVTYVDSDGTTKTISEPVDLYEAYTKGYVVKDAAGYEYQVSYKDVDNTFATNMVMAGGCTDSTWPTDKNSSSYEKKTIMNRINIMIRSGVEAPNGGGERIGIKSTTDKLPEAGEKYNITLQKINGGFMITTYDYQTGLTSSKLDFEDELECEDFMKKQNDEYSYVGFFACRWADCTVSNIELHETDPATDPQYTSDGVEAVAPRITIQSSLNVNFTDYDLIFKANNDNGGYASISQNGKTIYSDTFVSKKRTVKKVTLVPDSVNNFTIVYTPSTADDLLSYEPYVYTFSVTHKSLESTQDTFYVGPNGSIKGDGTRENPLDLETALGFVKAGSTIICLDGTYKLRNTDAGIINIPSTSSGKPGQVITIKADEGATPVLDLEDEYNGFAVDADYWVFDGLTVKRAGGNMKAFQLAGQYNVVKNCTFTENGDTGFQVSRINSSDTIMDMWPAYNLIQSCESYNNCDPSKNNADGMAAKLTVGKGNVFEDCISHHNLDDGWDCYTKLSTGAIGAVTLENCITYRQGYQLNEDGTETDFGGTSGGNGFKLGGENIAVMHYLKDCKTFLNKSAGVDSNNNPELKARNVILYQNADNNFALYSGSSSEYTDGQGRKYDDNHRSYKFNYDIKGAVSVGSAVDYIGSFNSQDSTGEHYHEDTEYGNVNTTPIVNETNYLKQFEDGEDGSTVQVNSLNESINPDTFFVSTDRTDSLGSNGRYSRSEDGTFIHGPFLERTVPYVHDAADAVKLPDNGASDNDDPTIPTESTDATSETTTRRYSGGGGGGGGGSVYKATTTTVASDSEVATTANGTSTTTEKPVITKDVEVTIGEYVVKIGTDDYTVDAAPYIQAATNSTLVPLRVVSLAIMGGDVANADNSEAIKWDNNTKTATILAGNKVIQFTAGSEIMVVDLKTMAMDNNAKAELNNGRMYVPFRSLGKALGVEVEWDGTNKVAKFIAETTTVATTEEVTEAASEEVSEDATEETTESVENVEETTAEVTTVA